MTTLEQHSSNTILSLLILAIENKNYRQTHAILAAGTDPNQIDARGFTPLHYVAKSTRFIKLLLFYSADINARSHVGETALHIAARYGCTHVVRVLIERGADVSIVNQNGHTALDVCARVPYILRLLPNARRYLMRECARVCTYLIPKPTQTFKTNECAVCLCAPSDPRVLPCGHVFCKKCLNACCATSVLLTFQCPLDRMVYVKSILNRLRAPSPMHVIENTI